MNGLIAFLRARLDEKEARAWAVRTFEPEPRDYSWFTAEQMYEVGAPHLMETEAEFIADNDPDTVLAEVDAKRRILEDHTTPHTVSDDGFCVEEGGPCTHAGESFCQWHGVDGCSTVRLLALSLDDHPDYRQEWRP